MHPPPLVALTVALSACVPNKDDDAFRPTTRKPKRERAAAGGKTKCIEAGRRRGCWCGAAAGDGSGAARTSPSVGDGSARKF